MLEFDTSQWNDPTSWPLSVDIFIAAAIYGLAKALWPWIYRHWAENWPATEGRIEFVCLPEAASSKVQMSFTFGDASFGGADNQEYVAEVNYSYIVAGQRQLGSYRRKFDSEEQAREFFRDLEGKSATVRYHPRKPSLSLLSQSDLESLASGRGPVRRFWE